MKGLIAKRSGRTHVFVDPKRVRALPKLRALYAPTFT